ncbi:MAG: DUF6247 family protein [Pseudonocardiaceae bacterium]
MTAAQAIPEPQGLLATASPAVVRAALLPEDVARFDEQWRAVMGAATDSYDLGAVHHLLDYWRQIARLTVGLGQDGYRQMLVQAERTARTGEMPADSVPIEEVRIRLAARIAAGPR